MEGWAVDTLTASGGVRRLGGLDGGSDVVDQAALARRFPKSFTWGFGTAAYQIEGATKEDGRGESIWDRFATIPGKTHRGESGEPACDSYHRWREDIALLKDLGATAYRFSIA